MLNSKQRAYLRSLASTYPTIMQVGKGGLSENLIKTISDALEARELIKLNILETSEDLPETVAVKLAEATGSEVVTVIGKKVILYRRASKKPKIELP